jgi:adenine-specific DNA methylase
MDRPAGFSGAALGTQMIEVERKAGQFRIHFACGFVTSWCYTLEAAGREADVHMAQVFPIPTERRPCCAVPEVKPPITAA